MFTKSTKATLTTFTLVGALLGGGLLSGCAPLEAQQPAAAAQSQSHEDMHAEASANQGAQAALYGAMRTLWADHMQWTYATVKDFFHNQDALQVTLDRLLQNQTDIGNAVAGFYGDEAGAKLTELLTEHIQLAVPVLTAAKDGDDAALNSSLEDWYANAQEIADFLTAANPDAWPAEATSEMMKGYIDTTVAYAVDLLSGDYDTSIKDYDKAFSHMMEMADALSAGIIAQFPDKF